MLKIGKHVIYEGMFSEITMISPVKGWSALEKKVDPESGPRPWFFYCGTLRGGCENFSFKTKRGAAIARNRLIAAVAEYERKKKESLRCSLIPDQKDGYRVKV